MQAFHSAPGKTIKPTISNWHTSTLYSIPGIQFPILADDSTRTFIPGTLGLGITFGKINKFTAGFDYLFTKWSGAKIPGAGNYAADSRSYRFGIEYIPDKYSNYSFFKRLEYRAGAHFGDTYLIIHNEQVKEYGFSVGLGIPMRRTYSRTNLFFDYTKYRGPGLVHRTY